MDEMWRVSQERERERDAAEERLLGLRRERDAAEESTLGLSEEERGGDGGIQKSDKQCCAVTQAAETPD